VDGVSAVDVGTIMLDPNPDGTEMPVPEERWDPDVPSPEMLFVRAATDRIRTPMRTARKAALSALSMPRETAGRVMRTAESFAGLAAGGPTATRTFLNEEIGRDRRVAFVRTDLDAVKQARGETGATVNDVILAVAAGGLRRTFKRRHERLPDRIVALVPMTFVPLSPQGRAFSIGVVSYDGGVFFGLAGDRELLADIDEVAADLERALVEQTRAADGASG
jgi:hypothetical protein